jgi:hypothetical protein
MRTALCTGLLLALGSVTASGAALECEQSEATITPAPGGQLEASVLHRVCATSTGAAAAVSVYVGPAGVAQAQGERVAAVAVPRSRDQWPRAVWRSETLLEVWVPNLANVLEVRPAWRDVQVQLKYCGDDPAERAAVAQYQVDLKEWMAAVTRWNEARFLDAEAAGPRPVRPREPDAKPRACRDGDIPRG